MKSKIENCLYMQVAHCNKCGGQSGYNIVDGEKVCFDCGEPYKADFSVSKVESTITTTNSQDQEENEPEKVYVEPYESANPEGAIKVEWKSRDEIADNLQAQFEYGRHGTYKDLESARKVFDKERVKEWDRTAMETYKQATQDTPEEWEEELMEIIGEATDLDEITDFIKQLLEERVENVLEQIQDWLSSDKGGDMDDEYLNILIDDIEELKLNTKKK